MLLFIMLLNSNARVSNENNGQIFITVLSELHQQNEIKAVCKLIRGTQQIPCKTFKLSTQSCRYHIVFVNWRYVFLYILKMLLRSLSTPSVKPFLLEKIVVFSMACVQFLFELLNNDDMFMVWYTMLLYIPKF